MFINDADVVIDKVKQKEACLLCFLTMEPLNIKRDNWSTLLKSGKSHVISIRHIIYQGNFNMTKIHLYHNCHCKYVIDHLSKG